MNRFVLASAAGVLAAAASQSLAQVNVALGKTVSVVSDQVDGGTLSSLTDGAFLPRFNDWQTNTVFWTEIDTTLEIDLGGTYDIFAAIVQADDNDGYRIDYHDPISDTWALLWDVPNYDAFGFGMQTRPNPDNDSELAILDTPRSTDRIRIYATGGDGFYSLSEVQLYQRIPAPGAMGLAALGVCTLARRRR